MRVALVASALVFAAAYVVHKRGIPPEDAPRYVVKRIVRRILHAVDAIRP